MAMVSEAGGDDEEDDGSVEVRGGEVRGKGLVRVVEEWMDMV